MCLQAVNPSLLQTDLHVLYSICFSLQNPPLPVNRKFCNVTTWNIIITTCYPGHFYVTRSRLACEGLLQGGRCGYVEMPSHLCGEVDSDEDVTLAELRLAKHGYRGPQASTDVELVLDAPTEFQ